MEEELVVMEDFQQMKIKKQKDNRKVKTLIEKLKCLTD
jgi:hypothetical protein